MPRVVIDNREVDVPAGSTLLEAARRVGIDIPTLCWREGFAPNTSCMVCVVKVTQRDEGTKARRHERSARGAGRLVPACATIAEEGMRVESETEEVREARRAALELLLSDHVGECRAPCQYACPFDTDVPRMLRQVAAGRLDQAIITLRKDVPLPAVLACVAVDVCEKACRRGAADEALSIVRLNRYVVEKDLTSETPYTPACKPSSGKRVAIVGAGPAGLSAAYFLLRAGHACTFFEQRDRPGGTLLDVPAEQLPGGLLEAEIALLEKLGARFELNTTVGRQPGLADLRRDYDALLIAVGQLQPGQADELGVPAPDGHLQVDRTTQKTLSSGVFAAGDVVRPRGQPVHAAAAGKVAAICIDQYLRGGPVVGRRKLGALGIARPAAEELAGLAAEAGSASRAIPSGAAAAGLTDEQAQAEAQRCLHCDCRKVESCKLRKYAEAYGADGRRYRGEHRQVVRPSGHPDIIYEPGKCILCGLCLQVTHQLGEPLGLTYVGRGFDAVVGVPFEESLAAALTIAGRRCVEVCPTGALAWRAE